MLLQAIVPSDGFKHFLVNLIKNPEEFLKFANKIVEVIIDITETVIDSVNCGIERINSLEKDRVEFKQQLRECQDGLRNLKLQAMSLMDSVKTFFKYAQ